MKNTKIRWLSLFALLALALPSFGTAPSYAQANSRTFPETGKTVQGKFLTYWDTHGGLAQQGFPISNEMQEKSDTDGKTYTVQYFERAVFEAHPENPAPNDVLLSLLGVFLYHQKYPSGASGQLASSAPDSHLFPETGKRVGGIFLQYWTTHGGLAQQGLPISEEFIEVSDLNHKSYKVQYFERAVFELHSEFAGTPNEVLLSQLGTFRYKQKYQTPQTTPVVPNPGQPTPVPPAGPTNTPVPSGPDCSGIPASTNMVVTPNCAAPGTVFEFEASGFHPGEIIGIYATRPDQSVFGARFQEPADGAGKVFVSLTTHTDSPTGIWAMSMESTQTHVKAVGYFKLASAAPPPPPRPGTTCDTSGTVDGSATPNHGRVGDTIVFAATGFRAGEAVSFWFTSPQGQVLGTPAPIPGGVNPDGTIGPLPLRLDSSLVPGRWALTFQGASSNHVSVIYFCVGQ